MAAREAGQGARVHLVCERLVRATGTRARQLSGMAGLENVALLRAADEPAQLRTLPAAARQVSVLGGGFVGLGGVAATAQALGKQVVVLAAAPIRRSRQIRPCR